MNAVQKTAKQNAEVLKTLKLHIGMGLNAEETEDCRATALINEKNKLLGQLEHKSLHIQIRITEIDTEFKAMVQSVSAQTANSFDDHRFQAKARKC